MSSLNCSLVLRVFFVGPEIYKYRYNCLNLIVFFKHFQRDFNSSKKLNFDGIDEAKGRLKQAGYEQLFEREDWKLQEGGKYFFTRNYSTIIAFAIGQKYTAGNGFHIVGAHTDSPCLKLKPCSKVSKGGFLGVAVQTYGSGLWHTWFDRDLTVAGRVILKQNIDDAISYRHKLVRIHEPILRLPTLAIHLDRGLNDEFKVNTQSHLLPVLATAIKAEVDRQGYKKDKCMSKTNCDQNSEKDQKAAEGGDSENKKHHLLLLELLASELSCKPEEICDFELQLCDIQPSVFAGVEKEFIFSGRLDNLCMSFCSLKV
ncbi:probable aspartyl aminopeptidase isoform X1 [Cryptomeria japonica]|uniref:probable aspartyl aminopeptidase isoform X1 n=1 Tax=Cryptomeria japonica TaxID=3369 RepID=UPI0025AD5C4D|nr:probable aspartyl aminopeptidase isoform X1 [Cryptomeria japonica]